MLSLTIVGLGGSIARVSRSRAALLRALEGAEAAGAETRMLDLRELDLPMYNPDEAEPTEAAAALIEACYAADGDRRDPLGRLGALGLAVERLAVGEPRRHADDLASERVADRVSRDRFGCRSCSSRSTPQPRCRRPR